MSDDEGKSKKKQRVSEGGDGDKPSKGSLQKTYEERVKAVSIISHPLASKKSTKKIYKLVKKASSSKHIRRGVKEILKGVRKGDKGLAILAGDVYPIDVTSHIPVMLEEKGIPYMFVPSKFDLGASAGTKRPTSCVLITDPTKTKDFDGQDLYDAIFEEAKAYDPSTVGVNSKD
jgi:H/ACA ribonucleoprotein complex subunit 2